MQFNYLVVFFQTEQCFAPKDGFTLMYVLLLLCIWNTCTRFLFTSLAHVNIQTVQPETKIVCKPLVKETMSETNTVFLHLYV